MLNNLTNFFNLIAGKRVKTTANPDDLITLGVRDPRTPGIYQPAAIKVSDLVVGGGMRKYVNTTLQTASITPGETLVGSYLIPANTFVSNGSFEFLIKAGVTSGLPSIQAKLYINTSSTLTGATLIATSTNNSTGYWNFVRNAIISTNVISVLGSTFQTNSDLVSGGFSQSTVAFDVTANRYFLVSLTPSSSASAEIRGVKFVQYES